MKRDSRHIKKIVRDGYSKIARQGTTCCSTNSCCGSVDAQSISKSVGYSPKEINAVPDGANLGLGCGNPVALASLKKGEVVLDLGSGAGFDAFLAAKRVGESGRVIGVDMTPQMIRRARQNAQKGGYANIEFRLGEIEKLPVKDESVDVIISNCVINLSPDKKAVFKEAFRVLKPGGRLMVSDLVLVKGLPRAIRESVEAYVGCLAGAIKKEEYLRYIKTAGFSRVDVIQENTYPLEAMANDVTVQAIQKKSNIRQKDLKNVEQAIASIKVSAVKGK